MRIFRVILLLVLALGLAACGPKSKFLKYRGPEVTQVQVHKASRKLYLLHNEKTLKSYDIALGFAPEGHKQFEGDGKTPEGLYYISHRNPDSNYHLSLGITYPNEADIAFAEAAGKDPGGEDLATRLDLGLCGPHRRGNRSRLFHGQTRNADLHPAVTAAVASSLRCKIEALPGTVRPPSPSSTRSCRRIPGTSRSRSIGQTDP
jgi:L,D-transpeptidase catalytic domain